MGFDPASVFRSKKRPSPILTSLTALFRALFAAALPLPSLLVVVEANAAVLSGRSRFFSPHRIPLSQFALLSASCVQRRLRAVASARAGCMLAY